MTIIVQVREAIGAGEKWQCTQRTDTLESGMECYPFVFL